MRRILPTILTLLAFEALAPSGATVQSAGAQSAPSVRAIDAAPFPSAMVASPKGNMVASVHNTEGVRSIWVAAAPAYAARRVVDFAKDDGQEVSQLAFAADGRTLWFVRGSGTNRAGENPNPTSDPKGAEQAIWRVRLDDNAAQAERVILGSAPTPSPTSDALLFARRGDVNLLSFKDGKAEGAAPSRCVVAPTSSAGRPTARRWPSCPIAARMPSWGSTM